MKCPECGTPMKVTREDHPYVESGLPNVRLLGVEFRICPKCGEREMAIPRLEQLLRTIALAVAEKSARLTGAEIRFLRKHFGWSGEDFARTMGVTPFTVSRWENEKEPMGATAERLLRLMALRDRPVAVYPNERLSDIAQGDARPIPLALRASKNGWTTAQAARLV